MMHKLLVAENNPGDRAALCRTLQSHFNDQLMVLEAEDGTAALELFNSESPEIAILNAELPVVSGLDIAKKIRTTGKLCLIVFISDLDVFSYAQQAVSLHALDYILKPYSEEKLVLSVAEAISYLPHLQDIFIPTPTIPDFPDSQTVAVLPEGTRLSLVQADIRAYIDAHYMEELSMKNVAHAMNYSDAYFCKLFKQCFHVNFSTFLNHYRIDRAKAMMGNPRISIKDISTACGYGDSNYFARIFKRITGFTPTDYRLSLMQKNIETAKKSMNHRHF